MDTIFVAGAWLLREIAALVIKSTVAGLGKIEFIRCRCGFTCMAQLEDGAKVKSYYNPRHTFKDDFSHTLEISGEFVNRTAENVIFTTPRIRFEHPDRPQFTHKGMSTFVDGQKTESILIPAKGLARVEFRIQVPKDMLDDYQGVLPVLEVKAGTGNVREFRMSAVSFFGSPLSAWPRRGKKPVTIGVSETDAA